MRGTILALALLTGAVALLAQNLTGVKAIAASENISRGPGSDRRKLNVFSPLGQKLG